MPRPSFPDRDLLEEYERQNAILCELVEAVDSLDPVRLKAAMKIAREYVA